MNSIPETKDWAKREFGNIFEEYNDSPRNMAGAATVEAAEFLEITATSMPKEVYIAREDRVKRRSIATGSE